MAAAAGRPASGLHGAARPRMAPDESGRAAPTRGTHHLVSSSERTAPPRLRDYHEIAHEPRPAPDSSDALPLSRLMSAPSAGGRAERRRRSLRRRCGWGLGHLAASLGTPRSPWVRAQRSAGAGVLVRAAHSREGRGAGSAQVPREGGPDGDLPPLTEGLRYSSNRSDALLGFCNVCARDGYNDDRERGTRN